MAGPISRPEWPGQETWLLVNTDKWGIDFGSANLKNNKLTCDNNRGWHIGLWHEYSQVSTKWAGWIKQAGWNIFEK